MLPTSHCCTDVLALLHGYPLLTTNWDEGTNVHVLYIRCEFTEEVRDIAILESKSTQTGASGESKSV